MTNPIKDIEDKKAWTDFGRQAYLVYSGARGEGASDKDAVKMVAAFFAGMFEGAGKANNDKEDENNS